MPPLRSLYCPQSKHSHASPSADPQKSVSCPAGAAASIHHIYRHRLQGTSEKKYLYKSRRESFKRTSLLIIDDFCLSTDYSAEDQEILFDILNDRYRYKSVIVTSQKSPDQWVKDLGGTTIAEAIVERLANNNFDLVLEDKSLRTSLTLPDSK